MNFFKNERVARFISMHKKRCKTDTVNIKETDGVFVMTCDVCKKKNEVGHLTLKEL